MLLKQLEFHSGSSQIVRLLTLGLLLTLLPAQQSLAGSASRNTIIIDSAWHTLNEPLIAVLSLPAGASAANPVPGCLIAHGSGGLFREDQAGEPCSTEPANMERNFRELADLFDANGVASIAPSSFVSRDARFCEDNDDDFFQFVPPPFYNPGDGVPDRDDDKYKIRRITIRNLDLLATMNYFCSLEMVDCSRTCQVGTSNGGSAVFSYSANDLQRHLMEYLDTSTQRVHESSSDFSERQQAFANFPTVSNELQQQLENRTLPRFTDAISPGCSLRKLIPTIAPDDNDFDPTQHLNDLYYPNDPIELHLEVGSEDDTPDACHGTGIRAHQAQAYEDILNITNSRYLVEIYPGADHNLLGEVGEEIHVKLEQLMQRHFFPGLLEDGFEAE